MADTCSTNAGTNAGVVIDHKLLSGGAGVAQTGVTVTPNDVTSPVVSYRATVVVGPAVNVAPTVTTNADQNVAASATVNLTSTAVDPDGTIASRLWAHTYPASGGPSITGSTSASASFTAGSAGALYVTRLTATDDASATGYDETETRVPLLSGEVTPLAAYGGVGVTVTNTGGAASEEAALADGSDATYVAFPAATGSAQARRWRWKPSVARGAGTFTHRLFLDTAGTIAVKARLYEATTMKAEWTITGLTTSAADYTTTLTSGQASAIGDWGNLWIEYEEV